MDKKADEVSKAANKPAEKKKLAERSKEIAQATNLATTLSPDALAEFAVGAAAKELNIM